MKFINNAWYVAGWSSELTHTLQAKTILDQPIVLFRRHDGRPAALEDMCPHRFLPLSMGELQDDDTLQCGYHGMTFASDGRCVRVPGQQRIPDNARVRSYPVAENMGLVWIWMGAPERADPAAIFDLAQYHDAGWGVGYGDALHIGAHYLSLADNLCDPAHVSFVHKTTLGSAAGEDIPVKSERRGDTVLTYRWTLDSAPVGFFQVFGDFQGHVDRWQYYYLHAPSTAIIDFGSADAGTGAPEGDRSRCIQVFSCHFLTPETATSTIDYWLHVRNFAAADEAVGDRISEQFRIAFAEDKVILEAAQQREDQFPGRRPVKIASDAGAGRLRQVIDEMLQREQTAQ
jgi:vanillate O-demethylase monooxygenase subunit